MGHFHDLLHNLFEIWYLECHSIVYQCIGVIFWCLVKRNSNSVIKAGIANFLEKFRRGASVHQKILIVLKSVNNRYLFISLFKIFWVLFGVGFKGFKVFVLDNLILFIFELFYDSLSVFIMVIFKDTGDFLAIWCDPAWRISPPIWAIIIRIFEDEG